MVNKYFVGAVVSIVFTIGVAVYAHHNWQSSLNFARSFGTYTSQELVSVLTTENKGIRKSRQAETRLKEQIDMGKMLRLQVLKKEVLFPNGSVDGGSQERNENTFKHMKQKGKDGVEKHRSRERVQTTTLRINSGSCIYGKPFNFTPALCNHPENRSRRVRIVIDSDDNNDPDARIYYARDVQQTRPDCGRGPHPTRSSTLNILWTEESTQIDQNLKTDLMNAFSIYLSFDPRPRPGYVFTNFGFDHLQRRIHKFNVTLPSDRRSVAKQGGLVVWTASNCHAFSNRLKYLQELNKVVPVHSLGKCWKTYSPKYMSGSSDRTKQEEAMGRTYKFWFSAENYLCEGYVSEKWWMPFAYGSVPVLYGSATHIEYAPATDAFINARSFSSAAALGKFLLYLDGNDTAYMRFHAWRKRDLSDLNPKFVQLVRRHQFGRDSRHDQYALVPPASLPPEGDDIDVRRWCNLASELLRQVDLEAGGKKRLQLAPLSSCNDPKGPEKL